MQSLSVDADNESSHQCKLTSAVIESLADKFGRRREARHAELRKVNDLAEALRAHAKWQLQEAFQELKETLSQVAPPKLDFMEGGPELGNAHWYRYDVIQTATSAGKFANFSEAHYFVRASIRVEDERLIFVTSFHHVGRELSGIMEATAFARLQSYENSEDREYAASDFSPCSLEPFVFTYKTEEAEIADAFSRWLDAAAAIAFKNYGDRL